jgi:hypothetical protein
MSEGGEARYAVCNRLVRVVPLWFILFSYMTIPIGLTKCGKTALSNLTHWNCLELNNQVDICVCVPLTQVSYIPHFTGTFRVQKT